MSKMETRAILADECELRSEGDGMSFTGYAIRYNVRSEPLPFRETILPGAAAKSIRSRNEIKAFINHDTNLVIGSTRAGTLRLSDDERGLLSNIDLPDTTYARDLSVSVARRDTSGMSFGFSVVKDAWNSDYTERTISELRLHEVSVVTGFPAYPQTTAAVRRLAMRTQQDADALSDAVTALESGDELSEDQATVLIAAVERLAPAKEPLTQTIADAIPLSIKSKMLDLKAKADF